MYLGIFNSDNLIEVESIEKDGYKIKLIIRPFQTVHEPNGIIQKTYVSFCLIELNIEKDGIVKKISFVNNKIALCFNEISKLESELDGLIRTQLNLIDMENKSIEELESKINSINKKEINKIQLNVFLQYMIRIIFPTFMIFYLLGLIHIFDKEIHFSRFHLLNEILTYFTFFFVMWSLLSLFGKIFTGKKLETLNKYLGFYNHRF
jgi:hypothetical protein